MSARYGTQPDSRTQLFSNVPAYNPNRSYPGSSGNSRVGTPLFSGANSMGGGLSGAGAGVTSRGNFHQHQTNSYSPGLDSGRTNSPYTSDSVMDTLESQNDQQIEGLTAKVKMFKDMTIKIGDEIRDSNKLLEDLGHNFESAQTKLKVTFNRMILMSERSGIPWKVWLGFFAFIFLMFFYVWWR